MKTFNLSDWALRHRSLVWYFMLVFSLAGLFSFFNLGRAEDPDFTIKTMIIQASWPGASVEDTVSQITNRIEKKLEELPSFDYARSLNTPGATTIFVNLRDTTKAKDIPDIWVKIRNMIGDIRSQFPEGVVGPFYNDSFGDVFGNIYGFTADGLSQRQLRDYVEEIRTKILTVPDVGKVDLIGAQDEVIYLEFSTRQIAALGITQKMIIDTLQAQNAISPSGVIEAEGERISMRVGGQFASEDSLRAINLRINDRFFRLGDVATIRRGYVDPPSALFRVNGEPAIGVAIGMKPNGNLMAFGEALKAEMARIEQELPIGIGVHLVSDQPEIVRDAIGGFIQALVEAVAIVLLVSFVSLGMRAGLVVAVSIPLVLAITFVVMEFSGISLQRISLGALIIALGLLVDDAMIAVEMMVARLEMGDPIEKAATYVYSHTAFPMLTGTLVTVVSFFPVALNNSNAGEFTFTLFVVIAVSLIVSWLVAVLFVPLLGVTMLPKTMKGHHDQPGRLTRGFGALLRLCVRWKWMTIAATVMMFGLSIFGMGFVQQQFFPSSDRTEVIIDWTARQNTAITETLAQIERFETTALAGDPDIDHWSSHIGEGAPRFLLSLDVQPASPNFGQIIIVTKDIAARERLRAKLRPILDRDFVGIDAFVHLLDIGPPVGRPVQYRVSGPDIATVREQAQKLASAIGQNAGLADIVYDWNEPARVLKIDVLQDKAAQLGVTSETVATTLNGLVGGSAITQVRDDIYLVDVVGRAQENERSSLDTLQNLQIQTSSGKSVPLAAIANIRYEFEQPIVWRRNRLPTLTIKAAINGNAQPATVVAALEPAVKAVQAQLPAGYHIAVGGAVEESAKSQGPILAVVPLMLLTMATILMIQLQSFQRLFMVFIVAPLALIGVVAALLPSGAPLGFVAILGVLALIGILIRNSVILVVQIEELRHEGMDGWSAVVKATEHRMRPILLTAAAASLALIPIAREIFWGPMAYAMMGGIIVGTVLTLLFLPALYVAWFRLKEPAPE
ncbi:efflux RND transporter permease subunit [Ancylobacter amanitiformis]|uniref:Multidrug efflux pump subunit AcrB n=1 Tax=Ancylobacter amanitiformis TaxID=217069 RepID=A0ABU0LKL2_9HYPH|nr:efflux RND transporter permease subunit [Ancylobacter amanitiformis]MDQ0509173.1 multidrug efflux pump subunit AcrB [Ancylobacter amanitiformis]